eukprot:snap_masked-scaffold_52-processed-gene-0.27-mRNA-1 protein AED:1.00 eAED:1.00 QI:0/0/0/0/1/1/2/0/328
MNREETIRMIAKLKTAEGYIANADISGAIVDHISIRFSTSSYWQLMASFEDPDMEEAILQYFLPTDPEISKLFMSKTLLGKDTSGYFFPFQAENIKSFQVYMKNTLSSLQLVDNLETCVSVFTNQFRDLAEVKYASVLFVALCSPEQRLIVEKFADSEYQSLVKNLYFILLELTFKFLPINLSTSADYATWGKYGVALYLAFYALQGVSEKHLTHKLVKKGGNALRIGLLYLGRPHEDRSDQIGGQNITTFQLDMPIVDPTYATRLAAINTRINNLPRNPKTLEGLNYLMLEELNQKLNLGERYAEIYDMSTIIATLAKYKKELRNIQ